MKASYHGLVSRAGFIPRAALCLVIFCLTRVLEAVVTCLCLQLLQSGVPGARGASAAPPVVSASERGLAIAPQGRGGLQAGVLGHRANRSNAKRQTAQRPVGFIMVCSCHHLISCHQPPSSVKISDASWERNSRHGEHAAQDFLHYSHTNDPNPNSL